MTTRRTFLALTLMLTIVSCGKTSHSSDAKPNPTDSLVTIRNMDIIVYELAIPLHDTFNIFPSTVVRLRKDTVKPIFLKFKSGGTETNVKIVDSVYANNYNSIWDAPASKRLDFSHRENGLLDISDLVNGTYFIRYTSCNIGGSYKLILSDK